MRRHLLGQFALDAPPLEQIEQSPPDHDAPFNTARTAADMRSYSLTSVSNCFRPAGDSRYSRTFRPLSETAQSAFTQPFRSSFCSAGYSDPSSTRSSSFDSV